MYNATIKQIQKIQTKSYILSVFHPLATANIKNTIFFKNSDVLEKTGDISRLKRRSVSHALHKRYGLFRNDKYAPHAILRYFARHIVIFRTLPIYHHVTIVVVTYATQPYHLPPPPIPPFGHCRYHNCHSPFAATTD